MKNCHLSVLLAAAASIECTQAWAPPSSRCNVRQQIVHHYRRPGPSRGNWEDDTKSSRNDNSVTDYVPPWREPEAMMNNTPEEFKQRGQLHDFRKPYGSTPASMPPPPPPPPVVRNDNTVRMPFQNVSNDDFRRPHGSIPSGNMNMPPPPRPTPPPPPPQPVVRNDNTVRMPFQTVSNDDFRRPHGMPSGVNVTPPPRHTVVKQPFQTSSTDDFRRSQDTASGVGAPQQTIYQKPASKLQNPPPSAMPASVKRFFDQQAAMAKASVTSLSDAAIDAQIRPTDSYDTTPSFTPAVPSAQVTAASYAQTSSPPLPTYAENAPSQATPPINVAEHELQQWDQKMTTAQANSKKILLRGMSLRDPPGIVRNTLINGISPVLASSAITLLTSTCIDRRLGQAALCGSLAGMSGMHLLPNLSMTALLGVATTASYEVLISINNLFSGIGGRIGASAFLATSVMAKYQGIRFVGRKMRRGLWSSAGLSSIASTMVIYHAIGAALTIFLRQSSDVDGAADPVRGSSVVESMAILALYGGTFVGMSLPSRLTNGNAPGKRRQGKPQSALSLVASFSAAGAMAGLVHAFTIHSGYFKGGWGGKVGLCAFAGTWAFRGAASTAEFMSQRQK
ncbi:hypothetical protein QTG54_000960 [Skeletonema marinoi]|uniref:Uncharacterized protein n=1 Tax=Skeletonema marinoi TaxID=267567 RepID=A0AAD9DIF3_9STRA|nr:hypothetical protein QTG54_000960 [Skeletonema marinoi]